MRQSGGISGAAIMMLAKAVNFAVSMVALAVVARILTPADYGVVAMVTAATNFFSIFSDFGLSLVTVQRPNINHQQLSTLFWINVAFGWLLAAGVLAASPLLVWINNGDSRLYAIAAVMALVFPISTLRVQHEALLKRGMLFRRLAIVRMSGIVIGALVGITLACAGFGYWALVGQFLATEGGATVVSWIALGWLPGRPRKCEGLRSMLSFGGSLAAHGFLGYWTTNLDNVLIGCRYGHDTLGLYSNAYQLMMRPISLAGYGVGEAAIPAMAKSLRNGKSVREAFRRMFTLTCLLGLPICIAGVLWAQDIVLTLLGEKYLKSAPILQALCVAAAARMLLTSTGWVYIVTDRPGRMLRWQLIWTPIVVVSFIAGLSFGPQGVAIGYAIANWIMFLPALLYCFHGTQFSSLDVLQTVVRPFACALGSALLAGSFQILLFPELKAGPVRLIALLTLALLCYAVTTVIFVPLAREAMHRAKSLLATAAT